MVKHELLAPAGNMECLKQAIFNGADAVYVGCKNFGARKFASNFSNDEIIEAIKLCHLYGVKIYATMNTLVKNNEVVEFLNQVEFLHRNGIDAILIQDFGMLCLVREKYPNLEIHASTQANTSSKQTAELFYKLGVKRVVFSREMSLEEINSIDIPIEKEVFIHGALCICYSGCCLMSSQIGNRSGNKGECAGSCRLPYTLECNGKIISKNKYLLSTKELNSTENFKALLESNIECFKVEGRMKSPEYVGFITRLYRQLIDDYENVNIKEKINELKTIFNRGFTKGHLFNCTEEELMNRESPNHIGLKIGQVVEMDNDKIKIKLTKPLNQQDGIRFLKSNKGLIVNYLYNKDKKLTNHVASGDICYIDNKINLTEKDIVSKTLDYKLNQSLKELPERKVPIRIAVKALIGQNLQIELFDGINQITSLGNVIEKAINTPMSIEQIKRQVTKLGNTAFICKDIFLECDPNIFIPIKELNDIRRQAIAALKEKRENRKPEVIIKEPIFTSSEKETISGLSASVYTEEQLLACQNLNIKRIYTADFNLYEKYKNYKKVYYKLPRCDRKITEKIMSRNIVSDYFNFKAFSDSISGDYGLNVYNIYTAYYLEKLGLDTITISVELSKEEIIDFINTYYHRFNQYPRIEVLSHGLIENMIIKDNILFLPENNYSYSLIDINKRKFPVYYDGINTHVLNFKYVNTKLSDKFKNKVLTRLDFYNETFEEVCSIIKEYQ